MSLLDMTGWRFGRLVVDSVLPYKISGTKEAAWRCLCDCGATVEVVGSSLRRGFTRSCGCLARELSAERGRIRKTRHGMHMTPTYQSWTAMIQRCTNPKNGEYKRYGSRGIKVCGAWLRSFERFYADVGPRPSRSHSIDRYPDKAGDYEPGNVRWATIVEQNRNLSSNRLLTFGGETLTVAEWSERTGLAYGTIRGRMDLGWDPARIVTAPVKHPRARRAV